MNHVQELKVTVMLSADEITDLRLEATWFDPCVKNHSPEVTSTLVNGTNQLVPFHPPPEAQQSALLSIGDAFLTNKSLNIVTIHVHNFLSFLFFKSFYH
jgi:hypothetical protein